MLLLVCSLMGMMLIVLMDVGEGCIVCVCVYHVLCNVLCKYSFASTRWAADCKSCL